MIRVEIVGVQINLMSNNRVVLLKEVASERYLAIWVGPPEAEAISVRLQEIEFGRPLTHDLLRNVIEAMGGEVEYIVVNELREDIFFARILVRLDGHRIDIDARPSDAMALAVRADVPIYVAEEVLDEAGIVPEHDLLVGEWVDGEPSAFDEFLGGLDIDDLPIH